MVYKKKMCDIFFAGEEYVLVQCISADLHTGDGIALEFNNRFKTMDKLMCKYANLVSRWDGGEHGMCIREENVLNLVTKRRSCDKPTLQTMGTALQDMRGICIAQGITKIAMPKIGCGYDVLSWNDVRERIKKVFTDTDIEMLVCFVKECEEGEWKYDAR